MSSIACGYTCTYMTTKAGGMLHMTGRTKATGEVRADAIKGRLQLVVEVD